MDIGLGLQNKENQCEEIPHKESSSILNRSQSESLEQHISENEYFSIVGICQYVEQMYGLSYTLLEMTEWLEKHHFSFKQTNSESKKLAEFYHDINQPLTAIICYSQGCLYTVTNTLDDTVLRNKLLIPLEQIRIQASNAAKIIHDMRSDLGALF